MNRRPLTRRERIVLAAGAGAVTLAVLAVHALPRWAAALETARLHQARAAARLDETQGMLHSLPFVVDSLETATEHLIPRLRFFHVVASPDEAAATLGAIVSDIASAESVRLDEIEPIADSVPRAEVGHVTVRIAGAGDVIGLSSWLADIEAHAPAIRVDSLSLRQLNATGGPEHPEEIAFTAQLSGLYLLRSPRVQP